jgi:hypothetical protein
MSCFYLLMAFAGMACSTDPDVCTLKGCNPGLIVRVSGIANVTAIEAESGGGAVYRYQCPGAGLLDTVSALP